jgi:hypothetical protein
VASEEEAGYCSVGEGTFVGLGEEDVYRRNR